MRYLSLILICSCFQLGLAQEQIKNPLLSKDLVQQQKYRDVIVRYHEILKGLIHQNFLGSISFE